MEADIPKETRDRLIGSIRRFFAEELEEEMSELHASLLLNFCLREIGPVVYNRAISDAQVLITDRVSDLADSCFEPEFTYWDR